MTPAGYSVQYDCHVCGETHLVIDELLIPGGPSEAGSLDELYPDGELPADVVRLLGELVWCDQAGDPIELEDPARVYLTPRVPGVALEG
jgi:hypothetical protein